MTLAVAFSVAGAIWFLYLLSANAEWWESGRRLTMIARPKLEFIAPQFEDIRAVGSSAQSMWRRLPRGGLYVGR